MQTLTLVCIFPPGCGVSLRLSISTERGGLWQRTVRVFSGCTAWSQHRRSQRLGSWSAFGEQRPRQHLHIPRRRRSRSRNQLFSLTGEWGPAFIVPCLLRQSSIFFQLEWLKYSRHHRELQHLKSGHHWGSSACRSVSRLLTTVVMGCLT